MTTVVREHTRHVVVCTKPSGERIVFSVCDSRAEAEALVARLGEYGSWADVERALPSDIAGVTRRAG